MYTLTNYLYKGQQVYEAFDGYGDGYYILNNKTNQYKDVTYYIDDFESQNGIKTEILDYTFQHGKERIVIDNEVDIDDPLIFNKAVTFDSFDFNNFRVKKHNKHQICTTRFKTNIMTYTPTHHINGIIMQYGKTINLIESEPLFDFLNETITFYKDNIDNSKPIEFDRIINSSKLYLEDSVNIWNNDKHIKIVKEICDLNDLFVNNNKNVNIILGFKLMFYQDHKKIILQMSISDIQLIE